METIRPNQFLPRFLKRGWVLLQGKEEEEERRTHERVKKIEMCDVGSGCWVLGGRRFGGRPVPRFDCCSAFHLCKNQKTNERMDLFIADGDIFLTTKKLY